MAEISNIGMLMAFSYWLLETFLGLGTVG